MSGEQRSPEPARTPFRSLWQIVRSTLGSCLRHRVTGLAAEAAFWTILSLPPLIFGLVGAIGFVAERFGVDAVQQFRTQLLDLASQALNDASVDQVIAPTLDDVLSSPRVSIISVGFVLALWAGSRAMNVFVDTITIMYGLGGRRSIVRTRALSFTLYLVFLVAGTVLLPLVLAGPAVVASLLPPNAEWGANLYWPTLLVGSVCILATLYHLSSPVRTPWRADLPGAALAFGVWIGGSIGLRTALDYSTTSTTIYGPLAAPIAVLLWLYVVALAILIGAGFNEAVNATFPQLLSRAKQRMRIRRHRARRLRHHLGDRLRTRLARWRAGRPNDDDAPSI